MTTELRDLDADRLHVEACRKSEDRDPPESVRYFSAGDVEELLDEIERLKRLLVRPWPHKGPTGKIGFVVPQSVLPFSNHGGFLFGTEFVWFPDDKTASAAVRKAALGK